MKPKEQQANAEKVLKNLKFRRQINMMNFLFKTGFSQQMYACTSGFSSVYLQLC